MTDQDTINLMRAIVSDLQSLIKAIHALDGLLQGDSNALENWQDEINHLYDLIEKLDE